MYMTVGEKIKKIRKEKGMTQEELAERLGYKSRSSVNKIELGQRDIPRSMVIKIAQILEINPLDLLSDFLDIKPEIDEIGKDRPLLEDEWTAFQKKILLLNDSGYEKLKEYVDTLISDGEVRQE